jgi:very-short-patch-repair endonuclease
MVMSSKRGKPEYQKELVVNAIEMYQGLLELPENVVLAFLKDRILPSVENLQNELELILSCESPIEQLMIISLLLSREGYDAYFETEPQFEMAIGKKKYRVDILLTMYVGKHPQDEILVAIECDGHDFHEKTKEQAAKDKARDRDFQNAGIPILHFTGSEIFKNANRCAEEAINILFKAAQEKESG